MLICAATEFDPESVFFFLFPSILRSIVQKPKKVLTSQANSLLETASKAADFREAARLFAKSNVSGQGCIDENTGVALQLSIEIMSLTVCYKNMSHTI